MEPSQWFRHKLRAIPIFVIEYITAPASVAQWTECQPMNQSIGSSIPSWGTCLGCRPGPLWGRGGTRDATTHWCFCLSLLPSFPLSKYNKILKEKKNILQIGTCFGSLVYVRSQNPLNWITSLASSGKWVYIQGWTKAGLQFWVHETVYSCITYLYYNCKPTFAHPCMF